MSGRECQDLLLISHSSQSLPGTGAHSGLSWLLLLMFQTQTRGAALAGCESAPAFVSLEPNPTPASTNQDFEPAFVTHTFPAGSAAAAFLPEELVCPSFPIPDSCRAPRCLERLLCPQCWEALGRSAGAWILAGTGVFRALPWLQVTGPSLPQNIPQHWNS